MISVSLFPFVEGTTGEFSSGHGSAAGHAEVVDLLVDLHAASLRVPAGIAAREYLAVAGESALRLALAELETAWSGGPYSEPARAALQSHEASVRRALEHHVRLAARVRNSEARWVLTHGEPHPGNVMRTMVGLKLIDWDTVLVAPPERNLAVVAKDSEHGLDRYEGASGRLVDRVALEMYRIRWDLAEIAIYVSQFRHPHVASEDVEASWRNLLHYLAREENWPDLTW